VYLFKVYLIGTFTLYSLKKYYKNHTCTIHVQSASFQGSKSRKVHHLHFTAWPDKGIPDDVTTLVEFRQRVLNASSTLDGPTLVHCRYSNVQLTLIYWRICFKCIIGISFHTNVFNCEKVFFADVSSAGIGRTGTYIALDLLTKEGETEGAVEIPGCIINMRQNRTNMVQTAVRCYALIPR